MILRIDTTSSTPVYAQIVDQVKRAIAAGHLKPGDSLPSLREMAVRLRINPLTVDKAYKLLDREGLIETRHGLGSRVTAGAVNGARAFTRETLTRAIDSIVVDACHMGVDLGELRQIFEQRIEIAGNGFQPKEGDDK